VAEKLTREQECYLDECFEEYKKESVKKLRFPLVGLAVVFAAAVSIFATYLYMQAKINVMEAQAEFAEVKKDFYEDVSEAKEKIDDLMISYRDRLEEWNTLAENAEASAQRMAAYEKSLEQIANNFAAMSSNTPPPDVDSNSPSTENTPPPLPEMTTPNMSRDIFKIPEQQQQQRAQPY
jgi:hypothetical protein